MNSPNRAQLCIAQSEILTQKGAKSMKNTRLSTYLESFDDFCKLLRPLIIVIEAGLIGEVV